jgi:predicted TPR repeat methyltransferase
MVRLRERAVDPAGAATYLERWLAVEPRWEIARDLGAARDAAGDRDGAVRAWREALALLPEGHPERTALERAIAD